MIEAEPSALRLATLSLWLALKTPRSVRSDSIVRRHLLWGTVAAVAIVAGALLLLDKLALRDWPDSWTSLAVVGTWIGDSGLWLVPSGLALLAIPLARRHVAPATADALQRRDQLRWKLIWLRLAFFFVDVAASGVLVNVGKRFIGRVRPHHLDGDGVLIFRFGHWSSRYASFPSGHSTTAFAVAVSVWLIFGSRAGLAATLLAVLVMICRVVVGAHFPSDVLAGASVGTVFTLAFATWLARRRLVFRETGTGGLAPRLLPRQRRPLRP